MEPFLIFPGFVAMFICMFVFSSTAITSSVEEGAGNEISIDFFIQ